jgi:hypothetical protein
MLSGPTPLVASSANQSVPARRGRANRPWQAETPAMRGSNRAGATQGNPSSIRHNRSTPSTTLLQTGFGTKKTQALQKVQVYKSL